MTVSNTDNPITLSTCVDFRVGGKPGCPKKNPRSPGEINNVYTVHGVNLQYYVIVVGISTAVVRLYLFRTTEFSNIFMYIMNAFGTSIFLYSQSGVLRGIYARGERCICLSVR